MRARILAVLLTALATALAASPASAQDEGWVIRSFDARYVIAEDGSVSASEDVIVDFGTLQRHGIFREIPFEYQYDSDNNRLLTFTNIAVDNGGNPRPFETSRSSGYLRLQIGDPDVEVSGVQRYRISYVVQGALNPFGDHDELFWNVTGNNWPVTIERASAAVELPGPAIQRIECYQGPTGSTDRCDLDGGRTRANFNSSVLLPPGAGLTVVVALDKGAVRVAPPVLVPADGGGRIDGFTDLFQPDAVQLVIAVMLLAAVIAGLARLWWLIGRDRWYGDTYYRTDNPQEATKPPFAHATIVVEYQPPEIDGGARRLRPAEIGLLMDERADTLDVSATIVDLAVRKYLLIREAPSGGIFGLFQTRDYELEKLRSPDASLLLYETNLLNALFEGDKTLVLLSDLKNKFHDDLQDVKKDLYRQGVRVNKLFPRDPDSVRLRFRLAAAGVAIVGGAVAWALGNVWGAGVIGLPIVLGGAGLYFLAPSLPRRSAVGWETYRRCLGFRLYMVTAETDRQKFAEDENIFHEYLPFAIVFGCVKKWAERFEVLGMQASDGGWYVGTHAFYPAVFADDINTFSTSIGNVMASTPGGSGGSGFGGGSGGGVGGGGGGSW